MATHRMTDASGQAFDIPEEMIKQASRDGLMLQGASPKGAPIPEALGVLQAHPYLDALGDTATTLLSGVGVGAMHTMRGLGEGFLKFGSPSEYTAQQAYVKNNPNAPNVRRANLLTTPNADEKLPFYAEQAAEFLAPEGLVSDVAKGVEGAKVLANSPRLAKAAGFATRVGAEAGVTGTVNAAQGKDFQEGAATGALSTVGGAAAGYGLKKVGGAILDSALNISGSKLRRVGSPAQFMFEQGGFAGQGAAGMRDTANIKAKQVYNQVSDLTKNSPNMVDLTPMRQTGRGFVKQFGRQQNPNLMAQGESLMDTANNVTLPSPVTGNMLTVPRNAQVPMTAAMDVRRGLGAARSWNGNNFFEPPANSMRDAMYGQMNQAMRDVHPELRQLDKAYSNYATIGDSIDRKSSLWPSLVAAGSAATTGAMVHGDALSAVVGGLAGIGIQKTMSSAPFGYALGRTGVGMPTLANFGKNAFLASQSDTQGTNPQ